MPIYTDLQDLILQLMVDAIMTELWFFFSIYFLK